MCTGFRGYHLWGFRNHGFDSEIDDDDDGNALS